jgi:putative tricarboxylic transport membrane protein
MPDTAKSLIDQSVRSVSRRKRQMLTLVRMASTLALAVVGLSALPQVGRAQTYPAKSITVVVPFPAGGPSDVVARIVTEHMSRTLRQPMVIENVAGAGGTLGSARVAAAQPDGYTLLAGSMGSHVSSLLEGRSLA